MLYRKKDSREWIAITQPTHAWLAGQLARAWGNEQFGEVVPWEEVCLGAEQHDIGHLAWEQAPHLNPQTGLPYSFMEIPRQEHVQVWVRAARLALPQGRYAALLVSLHGTGLYARYDPTADTRANVLAVQTYLEQEQLFQENLRSILAVDPYYRAYATPEALARNQRLIQIWDLLSLMICSGGWQSRSVPLVPTATAIAGATLNLRVSEDDPTHVLLTPWPFRQQQVNLVYEGRILTETFSDEEAMREALKSAPWVTLQTRLSPDEVVR
jgi:hypothetical protein